MIEGHIGSLHTDKPRLRTFAVLAASSLLAAACSTTAATPGSSSRPTRSRPPRNGLLPAAAATIPPTIAWHSCQSGSDLCGTLAVPVSYRDPSLGSLRLAVFAVPRLGSAVGSTATTTAHALEGPDLLLNPGGPGESGVQFLEQAQSSFPAPLRERFNLVSWDPRGVGASSPSVQCVSPAALRALLDVTPAPTLAEVPGFVSSVRGFDRACGEHTPRELLENMDTEATAFDLDRLRWALHQPRLDYLGFSYGTFIGYEYALAFPSHVRAMVLDGAIDPKLPVTAASLQQAEGLENDLHEFFAWCPTSSTCRSRLPDGAEREFEDLTSRLKRGGTLLASLVPAVGGVQRIGYGDAFVGLVAPLYSRNEWPTLAQAIEEALRGDGNLLAELAFQYAGFNANGTVENVEAADSATTCADHPSSLSLGRIESLAREWAGPAPDFGPAEAYSLYGCTPWPVRGGGAPVARHSLRDLAPIVVVGSTEDPVTPYAWAKALSAALPRSVLLSRAGAGHTAYFASSCVERLVDSYLESLNLPPPDTVCRSNVG